MASRADLYTQQLNSDFLTLYGSCYVFSVLEKELGSNWTDKCVESRDGLLEPLALSIRQIHYIRPESLITAPMTKDKPTRLRRGVTLEVFILVDTEGTQG